MKFQQRIINLLSERERYSAMYKALGNSMAVNVMQLLGERIQMVDDIK